MKPIQNSKFKIQDYFAFGILNYSPAGSFLVFHFAFLTGLAGRQS
jgi:hypothetical protein